MTRKHFSNKVMIFILFITLAGFIHIASAYYISGYVSDSSTGEPLSNVNVTTDTGMVAITDTSGFFNFINLDNGTYIINADLAGYSTNSMEWTINDTNIDNANISLIPLVISTYSISGYILDSFSFEGMNRANVTTDTGMQTPTDSTGFYIFSGLNDGNYMITAKLFTYFDNSTNHTISGADITNANIILTPISCTECHYNMTYLNKIGKDEFYVNQTMVNESVHAALSCKDCHTKGHNSIYARKMCEDCHANQQNPQTNKNRHNIVNNPWNNMYDGISAVNIISCTTCHNATLFDNSKNTYGKEKGIDCDYCHTFPDNVID